MKFCTDGASFCALLVALSLRQRQPMRYRPMNLFIHPAEPLKRSEPATSECNSRTNLTIFFRSTFDVTRKPLRRWLPIQTTHSRSAFSYLAGLRSRQRNV